MKKIYVLMFLVFSFLGFSQTPRNLFEEATQREMVKLSKSFSINNSQKEELHELLYRKYKNYYGRSERPSVEVIKSFEDEVRNGILSLLNLSATNLTSTQKKILSEVVVYKTEF